jgi:hypothetical protein
MFEALLVNNESINAEACVAIASRSRCLVIPRGHEKRRSRAIYDSECAPRLRTRRFRHPTFFMDDRMFSGNDRLVLLDDYSHINIFAELAVLAPSQTVEAQRTQSCVDGPRAERPRRVYLVRLISETVSVDQIARRCRPARARRARRADRLLRACGPVLARLMTMTSSSLLMTAAPCRPAPGRCTRRTSPASSRLAGRSASRVRRARPPHVGARSRVRSTR